GRRQNAFGHVMNEVEVRRVARADVGAVDGGAPGDMTFRVAVDGQQAEDVALKGRERHYRPRPSTSSAAARRPRLPPWIRNPFTITGIRDSVTTRSGFRCQKHAA